LPSAEELRALTQAMDEAVARDRPVPEAGAALASPRRRVLEDLAWAILTSTEFLFNH
jgi:hypothetical protein